MRSKSESNGARRDGARRVEAAERECSWLDVVGLTAMFIVVVLL